RRANGSLEWSRRFESFGHQSIPHRALGLGTVSDRQNTNWNRRKCPCGRIRDLIKTHSSALDKTEARYGCISSDQTQSNGGIPLTSTLQCHPIRERVGFHGKRR